MTRSNARELAVHLIYAQEFTGDEPEMVIATRLEKEYYGNLSAEAYELANYFLLVLCFTGFGTAYEMPTLIGIVRAGGDSKFVFWNDLISIFGITIPLSFLAAFVFNWHPAIVVLCLNSDQVFKCGAAFFKSNSYTWMKNLTRKEQS